MNNKEYEDRQTIYQQKELEKLKQNNTDSDSHDYFSLNRNASNVGSANSSAKNEFSSSVLRGGDVINPDKIIIENGQVTWKKRSKILIGGDSITIPLEKIASVELKTGVIGTDIIIRSNGRGSINAENFATADAKQIKSLLGF